MKQHLPVLAATSLKPQAEPYWRWHQIHPAAKLPTAVAREGAGSEVRTKFMHVGTVMPIYLAIIAYLESLPSTNGLKLIELGSGSGRVLAYMKKRFPDMQIYGTDYSQACIAYANKHYGSYGITFKKMRPPKAPFRSQTFDMVISSHVIEHIKKEEGKQFLLEIQRLLKRGGLAFIGTPNRERCQNIYMENPTDNPKYRLVPPHEHEYTEAELVKVAQSVFGKQKIGLAKITNPKFATVFSQAITQFRPNGTRKHQIKQVAYRFGTRFLPRPFFDTIAQRGTARIMQKHKLTYEDILYANEILSPNGEKPADNFLLICKR